MWVLVSKRSVKTLAHSELKRSLIGAFLHALWLVYYFQNKDGSSLSSSWKQRSSFFSVWDLKGGQNSCLIVWKTVTLPLEAAARNNSKIVYASIGVRKNVPIFQHWCECYARCDWSLPMVYQSTDTWMTSRKTYFLCFVQPQGAPFGGWNPDPV